MQNNTNLEIKQSFLSSAISDVSSYIHLADTKVSIVMAAVVAILAGLASCYQPIASAICNIIPCSWIGVSFLILAILFGVSVFGVFLFGLLTVRGHKSIIGYKSKWYLPQSTKEYSFDEFAKDVRNMTDEDIIDNMAAELYKLNDINRQKSTTLKWSLRLFACFLTSIACIGILFLVNMI